MSVEDCTLSITAYPDPISSTQKGQPIPFGEQAVAVIKDVSVAYAEDKKYRKTWGSRRDRFYVKGAIKISGKFTFETITPEGWAMMQETPSGARDPVYTIKGVFTDATWTGRTYVMAVNDVQIESKDFSFNTTDGPGDMPFSYRAESMTVWTGNVTSSYTANKFPL
jgi:hypothetical protein